MAVTRPEIIDLSIVINECGVYLDCLLAYAGQNYDYNLNEIFFHDLKIENPDVYMNAVGGDLGKTIGNIINRSYNRWVWIKDTQKWNMVFSAHRECAKKCYGELYTGLLIIATEGIKYFYPDVEKAAENTQESLLFYCFEIEEGGNFHVRTGKLFELLYKR